MRTLVLTLLVLAIPRLVLACPVCFGQSDSPLARGVNMGIFVMLGFVAVVLAAFASFFIYLMRRARLADAVHPAGTGSHAEGTAQC
jgi:hypothetical protein